MSTAVDVTAGADPQAAPAAEIELAPYALVRLAALPHPPPPAATAPFRAAVGRLTELRARLEEAAPQLSDALYDSAASHSAQFHRRVVLPLRRDIHNGRPPRPALLAALGDLPERIPALREWLAATAASAAVQAELVAATPDALAAERAALAATCRADPLRRAVTLSGRDLPHGIDRVAAAGATPDARARKAETTALRYALRATAKTSPLSWFTYVAWGEWAGDGQPERTGGQPVATVRANRTLPAILVHTVLTRPAVRQLVPHRLAPALRVAGGRVSFRRDIPTEGGGQVFGAREEHAELGYAKPLGLVLDLVGAAEPVGVLPTELVTALASRIPGPPERAAAVAARYVGQLLEADLLVPVAPVNPQDPQVVRAVASWLDRLDPAAAGELGELSGRLRGIDAGTGAFGTLPAGERPGALDELRDQWRGALTVAGAGWRDAPPLTEDVGVPEPARLGRAHGRTAAAELPQLAALAEIFDQYLPVRRLTRDRFVARYGVGGECRHASEFSMEMAAVWRAAGLVALDGTIDDNAGELAEQLTPPLRELAEIRAGLTAAVRDAGEAGTEEVRVPPAVMRQAAQALPGWARGRPASYSFFVQPAVARSRTLLVVNHVYAGWGRFVSRFLDQVAPAARAAVAAQLRQVLGPDARVAQFRPVNGFNANLHPLVVDDEVGEDPAWATIAADRLSVYHDPDTDQVRLRLAGTRQPLDVLYLGFLVPFILPNRLAHLHLDLGSGLVDFRHLVASHRTGDARVRARLRYQSLVLARRSWYLPAEVVAALRADLDRDRDVPAATAARWAARLGLPAAVFIAPARRALPNNTQEYLRYLTQPKPQYVDLTNALHLRSLPRLLARHDGDVRVEEALPVPGVGNPDGRVVELVTETYRRATRHD